jgi:hypothetical protein
VRHDSQLSFARLLRVLARELAALEHVFLARELAVTIDRWAEWKASSVTGKRSCCDSWRRKGRDRFGRDML